MATYLSDLYKRLRYNRSEIYKKLEDKGVQVPYYKDEFEKACTSLDKKTLENLENCIKGVNVAIDKLNSDDPVIEAAGAFDLIASVTSLIPEVGPVISGLCLLIANVLLTFGRKTKDTNMAAAFEHVVEKVLGKYHDEDVKAAAAGAKSELNNLLAYLAGYILTSSSADTAQKWKDLASRDVDFLNVGTDCLGRLEYYINLYSVNKDSEDEDAVARQARCAIDYIDVYLELSEIRKLLLSVYYCSLITAKGEFEAKKKGLRMTLKYASKKEKEIANVAPVEFTSPANAVLASVFNLSEHPRIRAFHPNSNSVIQMHGAVVQIKPLNSPERCLVVSVDGGLTGSYGTKWLPPPPNEYFIDDSDKCLNKTASCFTFQSIGFDNQFTCKDLKENRQLRKVKYDKGRAIAIERWKLIRLFERCQNPDDQRYLISSVDFPARFLYHIQNCRGQVLTLLREPYTNGVWYLDKAGATRALSDPNRDKKDCSIL